MAQSDIIFLSLPGEHQVREVVLGDDGLLTHAKPDQIIVDCSTCPVRLAQEIAEAAAERRSVPRRSRGAASKQLRTAP